MLDTRLRPAAVDGAFATGLARARRRGPKRAASIDESEADVLAREAMTSGDAHRSMQDEAMAELTPPLIDAGAAQSTAACPKRLTTSLYWCVLASHHPSIRSAQAAPSS